MERKIGERFDYNGVTLEVVNQIGCEGCYFYTLVMCDKSLGKCYDMDRSDKQSVIFKEVTK